MQTYDLKDNTVRELNQALHQESAQAGDFEVIHPNGKHSVAVGAKYESNVTIDGHVG